MKKSILLTAFLLLTCLHAGMSQDEEPQSDTSATGIVGVWRLVAKNGQPVEGYRHIKIITETRFLWLRYTLEGVVFQSMGGTYTLEGMSYTEFIEITTPNLISYKGVSATNMIEIKDNKLIQKGTISGMDMLDEIWERIDSNNLLPL